MTNISLTPHQALALKVAQEAGENYRAAKDARVTAARECRASGLTWAQTGAALGINDDSAIGLVARADKAAK